MKLSVFHATVVGIALCGVAQASHGVAQQSEPPSQSQSPSDTNDQQSARPFIGRIARVRQRLVLREASTRTVYQLDDQQKARKFEGEEVKVIATMDPVTNTLHVVDIAAVK